MGAINKIINTIKMNNEVDEDEYFDDYDVEDTAPAPRRNSRTDADDEKSRRFNKVTPISSKKKMNSQSMEIYCIKPESMEDSKEITDTLLANKAVILNLGNVDIDLARRVLDFTLGTSYALNGTLQRITDSIFVIVPEGVDISGAFLDGVTE